MLERWFRGVWLRPRRACIAVQKNGLIQPFQLKVSDEMVGKRIENVAAWRRRQSAEGASWRNFFYRKVFRGNEMMDCSLLTELELTAWETLTWKGPGITVTQYNKRQLAASTRLARYSVLRRFLGKTLEERESWAHIPASEELVSGQIWGKQNEKRRLKLSKLGEANFDRCFGILKILLFQSANTTIWLSFPRFLKIWYSNRTHSFVVWPPFHCYLRRLNRQKIELKTAFHRN